MPQSPLEAKIRNWQVTLIGTDAIWGTGITDVLFTGALWCQRALIVLRYPLTDLIC